MMLRMWRPNRALKAALQYGIAGVVFASQGDRTYPNRIRVFGNRGLRIPKIPYIVVRQDQYRELAKLVKKSAEAQHDKDGKDDKDDKDDKKSSDKGSSESSESTSDKSKKSDKGDKDSSKSKTSAKSDGKKKGGKKNAA